MKYLSVLVLGVLLAFPIQAKADDSVAATKLGEEYTKATAGVKLALICIGKADKKLSFREAPKAINGVVLAELAKVKGSLAKLKKLGELRKAAQDYLKTANKARRSARKRYASFYEPDAALQRAVISRYVVDTAGAAPSLQALACLKTVRDHTAWTSHGSVVLAFLQEALARDATYSKADHGGKLAILKDLDGKGLMSTFTRASLEKPILADWMSSLIKAGKKPEDLISGLDKLKRDGSVGFFAWQWASQTATKLKELNYE